MFNYDFLHDNCFRICAIIYFYNDGKKAFINQPGAIKAAIIRIRQ